MRCAASRSRGAPTLAGPQAAAALEAVRAHCDALPCCDDAAGSDAPAAAAAAAAWAAQRGVSSRVRAAVFDGLKGAAAEDDVPAGEPVVSLPLSALLTARLAYSAPVLGAVLRQIPGLDDDRAVLLWTMRERADPQSPHAPLWASLPQQPLGTGLTFPPAALAALQGCTLHTEIERMQAAARDEYDAMFPQLCDALPEVFSPASAYTFEAYCAAAELWQSYAVQVALPGEAKPCSALLPQALLLNHGLQPHVVRFSTPDADGVLRLRALRRCHAGRQVFLSYGALHNAHLLLFYGFALPGNPYDAVNMSFELPDAEDADGERALRLRCSLLERWQLGLDHSLRRGTRLPLRLLGSLRVLTASLPELQACSRDPRTAPLSAENEETVVATLAQTIEAVRDALPPVPATRAADPATAAALDHCATFLQAQHDILADAARQCDAMQAVL
jgi:histone-lysine N-methyltransferase SETD3